MTVTEVYNNQSIEQSRLFQAEATNEYTKNCFRGWNTNRRLSIFMLYHVNLNLCFNI